MKFIFVLTQDPNNLSVLLIQEALKNQLKEASLEDEIEVRNVSLEKIIICTENNTVKITTSSTTEEIISLDDILLVMKRTWGPDRYRGLELCKIFESQDIPILNGCSFIQWSHSKIAQYKQLENKNIFPKSLCYDQGTVERMLKSEIDLNEILESVETNLSFPVVFKTSEGTRGSGIYLIESAEILKNRLLQFVIELQNFIKEENISKVREWMSGFLIQSYIETHNEPNIAAYYRINVINNEAQSAVQFALQWEETQWGYRKLTTKPSTLDHPINLEDLNFEPIRSIIQSSPYVLDVVGIDIVCSKEGELFLLEFNDGPNVSEIVQLGKKYLNNPCKNFSNEIAFLVLDQVKTQLMSRLNI